MLNHNEISQYLLEKTHEEALLYLLNLLDSLNYNDYENLAWTYYHIAIVFEKSGQISEYTKYIHQSNEIATENQYRTLSIKILQSLIYNANIQSDWESILTFCNSLLQYKNLITEHEFFIVIFNKANTYLWMQDIPAWQNEMSTIAQFVDKGNSYYDFKYYSLLAIYYKEIKNYKEANVCFEKVLTYRANVGSEEFFSVYKSYGNNLVALNQYEKAQFVLESCYDFFQQAVNPSLSNYFNTITYLMELYATTGQIKPIAQLVRTIQNLQNKNPKTSIHQSLKLHKLNLAFEKSTLENKALIEKQKFKDHFTNTVVHEFRTPLAGIIGMIDLLQQNLLQEEQTLQLQYLNRSSQNLLQFVNDLLDMSKIQAGRMEWVVSTCNLKEIVGDVAQTIFQKLRDNNNTLKIDIDHAIPEFVETDIVRLNQILLNLLNNAAKFTKNGTINLTIELTETKKEAFHLMFHVQDTGVGIETAKLPKIFESFFQLNNEVNSKQRGTGLGLAIVKNLVKLNGGDITVTSELNQGSKFSFSFVVYKSKPQKSNNAIENNNKELSIKKAWILEDNKVVSYYLRKKLNRLGIEIEIFESEKECNVTQTTVFPELIFLDYYLEDINAYELLEKWNKLENFKQQQPKIISIGSEFDPIKIANLKKLGITEFMQKPFSHQDIEHIMKLFVI